MKEKFDRPEIDVIQFEKNDVIATSMAPIIVDTEPAQGFEE